MAPRYWLGLGENTDAQIDMEEYVREHPVEDPDYELETERAEIAYEVWLGGEA